MYDQYGVIVLRQGIKGTNGLYSGGYVYQQNCYAIFDNYFLKNNTFYDICDKNGTEVEGSLFGSAFGGVNQPKLPPMQTIQVVVPTTLKEFYNGCIKTVSYQKQTIALDGKTHTQTVCNKQIEIKAGMDTHTSLTYPAEGHQQQGSKHSHLFVIFQQIPPNYQSPDFLVT